MGLFKYAEQFAHKCKANNHDKDMKLFSLFIDIIKLRNNFKESSHSIDLFVRSGIETINKAALAAQLRCYEFFGHIQVQKRAFPLGPDPAE